MIKELWNRVIFTPRYTLKTCFHLTTLVSVVPTAGRYRRSLCFRLGIASRYVCLDWKVFSGPEENLS